MQQNITITGNLTKEIEVRDAGKSKVAKFSLAVNPTRFNRDTGEWDEEPTVFWNCEAWNTIGTNLAASAGKGDPLIVTGTVHTSEYTTDDGEERRSTFVRVDDAALSVRFHPITANE